MLGRDGRRQGTQRAEERHPEAGAPDDRTLLADGRSHGCGEVSSALDLPPSTSSYHLRLLREAGVTRTRAEGTVRLVSLRRDDLDMRFPGLLNVLTR